MDLITILIAVLIIVVIGVAFVLYKAGYRLGNIIKVKAGPIEADLARNPVRPAGQDTTASQPAPVPFSQEAAAGGVISESTIKAPAKSPARAAG